MRSPLILPRVLLFGLIGLLLTACGGGGTGGPLSDNGGTDGSGTVVTPFFAATGPGGVDLSAVTLSFTDSADVTVQVTDTTGAAIVGASVAYSFDVPVASTKTNLQNSEAVIASGTLTTDASGLITIPLVITDPSALGTGVLTLTSSGFFISFDITVQSAVGVPADIELALVDVNTGLPVTGIEFTSGARVEITVTEADGSALSDSIIVDASATAGTVSPSIILVSGGSSNFVISRTTGIDDFTAVEIEVSVDVVDAAGDIQTISETLLSEFLPSGATGSGGAAGVPSSLFPVPFLQDPDSPGVAITAISAEDPGELVVTVVDFAGDPVPNAIVSVQTDLGDLSPSLGNVLTNTSGVATIGLAVGSGESGAAGTLTISVGDDLQYTTNFEIVDTGTTSTSGLALALQLFNSTDGTATSTINSVEPGLLRATLTNVISGLPVQGEIIEISVDVGDPELTPASGQILTDVNGEAEILVGVGTSQAGAAISLLADVSDLSSVIQFSVGSADIQIGRDPDGDYSAVDAGTFVLSEIDIAGGANTLALAAGGNAIVKVAVVDGSTDLFTTPLTVNFTSDCAALGLATIDTGVTTVNGVATATYNADGCESTDTIRASLVEISGATAVGTVDVASAAVSSIEFVSATPEQIFIGGSDSVLVFHVTDETGNDANGQSVNFSLSTDLGGVALQSTTGSTGVSGNVTVRVTPGNVPTPVQVIATIDIGGGETVSTVSNTLVVSTGRPDQDSFSLSASVLNPGGADIDGVESILTIRAADAFNNPVPDGTAINFITEYGAVDDSCSTTDGACTVTWRSQSPREVFFPNTTGTMRTINNTACDWDDDGADGDDTTGDPCFVVGETFPLGQVYSGRTTILAYAVGDESFIDSNGNGIYDYIDNGNGVYDGEPTDTLEPFVDLPEAFRDDNEDGVFGSETLNVDNDAGLPCTSDDGRDQCSGWLEGGQEEEFVDLDTDGNYDGDQDTDDANGSVGNGIYNGVLCAEEVELAGDCSSSPVSVRDELVVLMSGSSPVIDFRNNDAFFSPLTTNVDASLGATVVLYISDFQNGYLASNSTITIVADNCKIGGDGTYTVGNTNAEGFTRITLNLSEDAETTITAGAVNVTVVSTITTGGGGSFEVENTAAFVCEDD
jgi:hypothetical protein